MSNNFLRAPTNQTNILKTPSNQLSSFENKLDNKKMAWTMTYQKYQPGTRARSDTIVVEGSM